jgi:hypothetical protein
MHARICNCIRNAYVSVYVYVFVYVYVNAYVIVYVNVYVCICKCKCICICIGKCKCLLLSFLSPSSTIAVDAPKQEGHLCSDIQYIYIYI